MLNRVQKFSFEDQRGPIDSENLKVPEFLLSNTQNLIKSQSLQQNIHTTTKKSPKISTNQQPSNSPGPSKVNLHATQSFSYTSRTATKTVNKNPLNSQFNESTASLPVITNTQANKLLNTDYESQYISRSRSPMIVYDNDEEPDTFGQYKTLEGSCIEESCVIDNSLSTGGFDKSIQSCNQNLSGSLLYETEHNVIPEDNEVENNANQQADSLRINNSSLSMSGSFHKASNSRISYV